MSTIAESPSPINRTHMPPAAQVVEIRATWSRAAQSPWAGYVMRHTALLADGSVVAMWGYEAGALLDALKAAGARLVQSVEGWSRVCRVTSEEASSAVARPRPGTLPEALAEMVAKGSAAKPGLAKRLESAAGLVGDGLVALVDDAEARIGPYHITAEACTCPDFTHRGGWCKHRLAARMARHLCANGFTLPQRAEPEKCPLIRRGDLALIASGQVIDESRRREMAYRESGHGARDRAMRMLGNGAVTLPAELARRAGVGRTTNDEPRVTNGGQS